MHTWQLQDAKNKFGKLVDNAQHDGPQIITNHGTEVAVVLSVEEYRKLLAINKKLSDFFRESPLADTELDLMRDKTPSQRVSYNMSYLLDTCVISELVAKHPNPKVVIWVDDISDEEMYLSVITLGEIQRGVEKLIDSPRKQTLRLWLETELPARLSGRILNIDADVMRVWGRFTAQLEQRGRTLPAMDSLIAAISLHANLQIVTRNEDDFTDTGIQIVNPWR